MAQHWCILSAMMHALLLVGFALEYLVGFHSLRIGREHATATQRHGHGWVTALDQGDQRQATRFNQRQSEAIRGRRSEVGNGGGYFGG